MVGVRVRVGARPRVRVACNETGAVGVCAVGGELGAQVLPDLVLGRHDGAQTRRVGEHLGRVRVTV